MAGLPDVVYLVRDGHENEELRYSLRSLINLPHRHVWLAGFQPSWTTNVGRIAVSQSSTKWNNQHRNLAAAVEVGQVSDPFVMFNDDFFVVLPLGAVPVLHRGPFTSVISQHRHRRDEYARRMRATAELCGDTANCYDQIHVPMTFQKEPLRRVLTESRGALFRTVYGNRLQVGGRVHHDVKVRGDQFCEGPFVSTSDATFARKQAGRRIRQMFPQPSPYEC
jgi:hypothetical protein